MRLARLSLFALVAACTPSGASLDVQLVTDYAPVRDFDTVTIRLDGASGRSTPAAGDRSYGRPTRVTRFDGLAAGRTRVIVSLESGGRVVQSQPRVVEVRSGVTTVSTVSITRDCEGVACPGAAAPAAIACLGGQCVDPMCSADHPELCPSACGGGCGTATVACVDRVCADEGVCIDTPDDGRCGAGELCVADEGCRMPFSGPADAGAGDTATGDAGFVDMPLPTFASGLAHEVCVALSICIGPSADDVPVPDCTRELSAAFVASMVPRVEAAVAAGTMRYDGTFATACLAVFDTMPCESLAWGAPPICENTLTGMVPLGGACDDTFECMGEAYCLTDGDAACPYGTCVARAGLGGACPATATESGEQRCERGLRCISGTCTMPAGLGLPCSADGDCATGEFCVGSGTARSCGNQTDLYARIESETCDMANGPLCMPGLSCVGTCVRPVGSGMPCTASVPDMCPTGEWCDTTLGHCTTLPADGSHCLDATHPVRCAPGLFCGSDGLGTCHELRPNGTECAVGPECASGVCSTTCQPPALCPL